MHIDSKHYLRIGEYGFVRDLHPAFNVSQNRFGHKSDYTKHLYYTLRSGKSKRVFFNNGVIGGRIIKRHNGSIDFIISDFEGKAYIVKNNKKGTPINDGKKLRGHIIFNINNHLYDIIDWKDMVDWSNSKSNNVNYYDYPGVNWDSEDEDINIIDNDNFATIDVISSWLHDYEADYFEIMAINDDKIISNKDDARVNYLKGIIQSLETSIDAIQRGGIEKGIDALARVYLKNAKQEYMILKKKSIIENHYSSDFYHSAGLVWGFREVMEYISGFPEEWQYNFVAENMTDSEMRSNQVHQISNVLGLESYEAESVKCYQCGKSGYDDEMSGDALGFLCARCSNPHIDFSKYNI